MENPDNELQERIKKFLNGIDKTFSECRQQKLPFPAKDIKWIDKFLKEIQNLAEKPQLTRQVDAKKTRLSVFNNMWALNYFHKCVKPQLAIEHTLNSKIAAQKNSCAILNEEAFYLALQNYTLVGYKGVHRTRAEKYLGGLAVEQDQQNGPTGGALRGDGFYVGFDPAKAQDYANTAAIKIGIENGKVVPPPQEDQEINNLEDMKARSRSMRESDIQNGKHNKSVEKYRETEDYKQEAVVLRVYVKNFFDLNSKNEPGVSETKVEDLSKEYDYLEAFMKGYSHADKYNREFVFPKKTEIYNKLKVTYSAGNNDPKLPTSTNEIHEKFKERIEKENTNAFISSSKTQGDEIEDGKKKFGTKPL